MIKTIPLILVNIKEFVRNWKSILLLIIFPLLLISSVFLSFNPNGLQRIPVGVISSSAEFNIDDYNDYFSYLQILKYSSLETCLYELHRSHQYCCIQITSSDAINLNVYYDNTNEPVIWEIIQRIKSTTEFIQKEKSKQMAGDFLTEFKVTLNKLEDYKSKLENTNSEIDNYIVNIDSSIKKQKNSQGFLSNSLVQMDNDISDIKSLKSEIKSEKDSYYSESKSYLNMLDQQIENIDDYENISSHYTNSMGGSVNNLDSELNSLNNEIDDYLDETDERLQNYDQMSSQGWNQVNNINTEIDNLEQTKLKLQDHKKEISKSEEEITQIQEKFMSIQDLSPEKLVNPVLMQSTPTYIPIAGADYLMDQNLTEENLAQQINKGLNLISLQTIFPTNLFLIILFLSLLVSSFICLQNINSPAKKRLNLIKGMFIPELVSIYFSSLIILFIPIFCILLVGNYLFMLEIIHNLPIVIIIILIVSSNFILLGMTISYLIKKKSTTLLICSFLLVFLIFLSGFLLPIERMSYIAGIIAKVLPSKIGLVAFKKIVFYNLILSDISLELFFLSIWLFIQTIVLSIIKAIRD